MNVVNNNRWRLDRHLNVAMLVQLVLLASLILGHWMDSQRRLDRVSYDVLRLGEQLERFSERLENVSDKTIAHEERMRSIERQVAGK
jgi:hypothetical protein